MCNQKGNRIPHISYFMLENDRLHNDDSGSAAAPRPDQSEKTWVGARGYLKLPQF
jgi:hypothetical protein